MVRQADRHRGRQQCCQTARYEMSILVVEDDLVLQGAIKLVLPGRVYLVFCAADGQEAPRQLRCGNRPDVILLEWMLPVLDGGRFLQEQRQDPALAAIPVISVTALERSRLSRNRRLHQEAFPTAGVAGGNPPPLLMRTQRDDHPARGIVHG